MDKTEFQIILQGAIVGNHNDFEKLITLYDPLIDKHCFINGKRDDDLKQYLLMHLALNINKFII